MTLREKLRNAKDPDTLDSIVKEATCEELRELVTQLVHEGVID